MESHSANSLFVESWYYVDTESFDIHRTKSIIKHPLGLVINDPKITAKTPVYIFDFLFRKNDKDDMILDVIESTASFNLYKGGEFLYDFKVNSLFYCYNSFNAKKRNKKKMKTNLDDLRLAAEANYNPIFWKNHEVIKKTPIENKVILDFEKAGFFGNFLQ